jgi:hypothetical protein
MEFFVSFAKLQNNRNNYAYPAVALDGHFQQPTIRQFQSTMDMDDYIHNLLHSLNHDEKILGYLSVVFWGFYSGQDGVIRRQRALERVALARDGKKRVVRGSPQRMRGIIDYGVDYIADLISEAIKYIQADSFSAALRTLNELPQLQIAFSSKVCAFLSPDKCGVIDSVIAANHPQFGFEVDRHGMVLNRTTNRNLYSNYCAYLQEMAGQINNSQIPYLWIDRDGIYHQWRALDVERALYKYHRMP